MPCGAALRLRSETYDLDTPVAGLPQEYSLCWADAPRGLQDYVFLGTFDLGGPERREFECTLGLDCNLTVRPARSPCSPPEKTHRASFKDQNPLCD